MAFRNKFVALSEHRQFFGFENQGQYDCGFIHHDGGCID
jgi:hypothetical protein